MPASSQTWAIVLAGGAGRRLTAVTGGVPKQFWRPTGRTSLLEDTLTRTGPFAPPERTVTIVDERHGPFVRNIDRPERLGAVIYQAADRGTAAGVALGLSHVLAQDPDAHVLLTPADHGVAHPDLFQAGLLVARTAIVEHVADPVLFGAEPDGPDVEYGWILPQLGTHGTHRLAPVARFVEKPDLAQAAELYATGGVWNTMVLIGRARTIFALYRAHLPLLANVFGRARRLPPRARDELLRDWYPHLPFADFSRDLIAPAAGLFTYVWSEAMGWSDLGTPDRLAAWLAATGSSWLSPTRRPAA